MPVSVPVCLFPRVCPGGADWHHVVTTKNFGVLGFLDWLHGTDMGYREYVEAWEAAQQQRRKANTGEAAKAE